MTDPFQRLGVRPLVNAHGPVTRFGGGVMAPEVAEAMRAATGHSVDIPELQAAASRLIAEFTGAEAGCVTSGASAAVLMGMAACLTGMDPAKMSRLPDTRGMANEVIVIRSQRNSYDHALRAAGATLVEVGLSDRQAGTGVRDAETWEIQSAVSDATAAIFFVAKPGAMPTLSQVSAVAREAGVPILVDAAAELPPMENLRAFLSQGADLVAFSGGKAINGPQGSGILCGRRDLVGAALLQQLDLDYAPNEWEPPAEFVTKPNRIDLPRHGVARSCKIGKEQIVGVLAALTLFGAETDERRALRHRAAAENLLAEIGDLSGLTADIIGEPDKGGMPVVRLRVEPQRAGLSATDLFKRLRSGTPRIETDPRQLDEGVVILSPACLRSGDEALIGHRLKEIVAASRP